MVYQFKVSLSGGYYSSKNKVERVIEIAGSRTLEDLVVELLNSLDFDFDHLYEFEINGTYYEGAPYYAPAGERCRVKILSLGLRKGDVFSLVYDFGDEWRFRIKVLDIIGSKGGPARVLESVGSVTQYPGEEEWDEWDAWNDEEDDDWDDWDEEDGPILMTWEYEPPDQLFDIAYQYKKTSLWKKLYESQMFAVRFSDGELGFVSIMGNTGQHCALAVYQGEDALATVRRLIFETPEVTGMDACEWMYQMDCLQLILDKKDYLREEEVDAARAYAERHDIRLAGKNAFAHFLRYKPSHVPWHPVSSQEELHLMEAATAAIALAEKLKQMPPHALGLFDISPLEELLPCLIMNQNGEVQFSEEKVQISELKEIEYPSPTKMPAKLTKKLKQLPKRGLMECKIALIEQPIQDGPDQVPYLPFGLFLMDGESGMALPPELMSDYEGDPDRARDHFLQILQDIGYLPEMIHVCDLRTYALMDPIAEQLDIRCVMVDELPQIEDLIIGLNMSMEDGSFFGFDEDDYDSYMDAQIAEMTGTDDEYEQNIRMIELILSFPEKELAAMPPDVKESLRMLIDAGMIPSDLAKKVRKRCKL